MRQVTRRDPAPSRLAYRLNRLWLTPSFWRTLRVGLPLGALALGAGIWLGDVERRAALVEGVAELRAGIESRPEFSIRTISVEGASDPVADAVRAALDLDLPLSSFDVDLSELRARVAGLDPVETASLNVQPGGELTIRVRERVPAILHRSDGALVLRDAGGHRIVEVARHEDAGELPFVVGQGAAAVIPEALAVFEASEAMSVPIRGLVRVGARRWDAVLDEDRRILLPEGDPVSALEQVIALDTAQDLFARQVSVIDMRNPARPTLRLGDHAFDELRRIRAEMK